MIRYKATRDGKSQFAREELEVDYSQPGLVNAPKEALALGYGILVYESARAALQDGADGIVEVEVRRRDRMQLPERVCSIDRLSLENIRAGVRTGGWPRGTEMYSQVWVVEREIPAGLLWRGM